MRRSGRIGLKFFDKIRAFSLPQPNEKAWNRIIAIKKAINENHDSLAVVEPRGIGLTQLGGFRID